IVTRQKARLQLADPIPALAPRPLRGGCEIALNTLLIHFPVIQRSEASRRTAQHSNSRERHAEDFEAGEIPYLPCEGEAALNFALDVGKRITGRKKIHDQNRVADACIHEVAGLPRRLKRAADVLAARSDMRSPRQDNIPDIQAHARLETAQSTPLNKFFGELPDAVGALVLAEPQAGDHSKPGIGHGRHVTVAALQGKSERLADGERVEV